MRRGYNLEYVSSKCTKIQDTLSFNKYCNKDNLSFKEVAKYINFTYKFSLRSLNLHKYFDIESVSDADPVYMHHIVYYIDEYDMCIKDDIVNNSFYYPSLEIFKDQELYYTTNCTKVLFMIVREGFYEKQ